MVTATQLRKYCAKKHSVRWAQEVLLLRVGSAHQ